MDSSMTDMMKFVEEASKLAQQSVQDLSEQERLVLKSLLKNAIQSYKDEVLRYKNGEINLWHLDSLYRNLDLTNRLPFRKTAQLELKRSLKEVVLGYLRAPHLNVLPPQVAENVTSNPCWYPEIETAWKVNFYEKNWKMLVSTWNIIPNASTGGKLLRLRSGTFPNNNSFL